MENHGSPKRELGMRIPRWRFGLPRLLLIRRLELRLLHCRRGALQLNQHLLRRSEVRVGLKSELELLLAQLVLLHVMQHLSELVMSLGVADGFAEGFVTLIILSAARQRESKRVGVFPVLGL